MRIEYKIHGWKTRRLGNGEKEYIDAYWHRTDKFGWVWWFWLPRLTFAEQNNGYYYSQRIIFIWIIFGCQIERMAWNNH